MEKFILAGDIGGTKTHLALFSETEKRKWKVDGLFKSADYPSLLELVLEFLSAHPQISVEKACFGIAGPIIDRKCKATNLPWVIDADLLQTKLNILSVSLVNDLEANAYGIQCLEEKEFFLINKGKQVKGNQALIAAGTGLGQAGIIWNGKTHVPFACEGGHCSFAAEDELQIELWRYLQKQYKHVSFERVLSGPGLQNIYRFILDQKIEKEEKEIEKDISSKMITQFALEKSSKACMKALDLFIQIYGAEAGNLALKMLAVGGVFIGGGIAPKIGRELFEKSFMLKFTDKGRFHSLLENIPVKIILNENTALLGAAYYAREYRGT